MQLISTMIGFRHINVLTIFSVTLSYTQAIHKVFTENEPTLDGQEYIKKIVKGEKMDDPQGILYFTAPYRICSGKGCNDKNENFHMVFPLYVGTKAKEKFRTIYTRDYEMVHSTSPNVPFKKYPTKHIWTLPPNCTTESTTAPSPDPTKEPPKEYDEGLKPPSVKPHCPVRISRVDFGPTTPEKTLRIVKRYFGKR